MSQQCLAVRLASRPKFILALLVSFAVPADGGWAQTDETRVWQDKSGATPPAKGAVEREDLPPPTLDTKSSSVIRDDLSPVMAADGSGLPNDLWQGLTVTEIGEMMAKLTIPPRSPALTGLWQRLILADVPGPGGAGASAQFAALRAEALDRSGLIDEALAMLSKSEGNASDPITAVLLAKTEIGLGNRDRGCEAAKSFRPAKMTLPRPVQADAILISAYCALAGSDQTAAALQLELARDLGLAEAAGFDFVDQATTGQKLSLQKGKELRVLDYRVAEAAGGLAPESVLDQATPALLTVLARAPTSAEALKLPAAEKAAAMTAIRASELAAIYRGPAPGADASAIERAALFKQAETEKTPLKKTRLIRAFLDEARHAGFYATALEMMAPSVEQLSPVAEIAWFSETAVEVGLISGNYESAKRWAKFASSQASAPGSTETHTHWLALADIADPAVTAGRAANLGSIEKMAIDGRFNALLLLRLATVLDALDINVPMPIWELASKQPQPEGGHLPETGVLSALGEASKQKQFGRTVLLAMKSLGPDGAGAAHLLSLGDSIRALKRAGLERDAHRLALEALFDAWPRTATY